MIINNMLHIMLDLETMGVAHDAAIVSIGAVRFRPANAEIRSRFKRNVTLESCATAGLRIDPGTVMWWLRQSDNARKNLEGGESLTDALADFTKWFHEGPVAGVWGNGAEFDNVILSNAYRAIGSRAPWKYTLNRCYRTIKEMSGMDVPPRTGIAHDALADAEYQALCLSLIVQNYARQKELGI